MQKFLKILQIKFLHIYNKYRENIFFNSLLKIFSYSYFFIYKFWLLLYKLNVLKKYTLKANVISIGNITAGGTGKTPLTIEIANHLIHKGYKVAVLSRGYKRKINNNEILNQVLVSDGQDILVDHETSGDEPYLIAKKSPKAIVIVGNDRVKAGLSAIRLGAEILILDDGYQHLKLNRNENILLIDSYKPFDNGQLIPAGLLREPPSAINRSTAIVLSNAEKPELKNLCLEKISSFTNGKPIISMHYKIKQFKALNIKKTMLSNEFKETAIAFCGIGNPKSFFNLLECSNIKIIDQIEFPDHHPYNYDDIKAVIQKAQKNNVENIITTEKDALKIEELCQASPVTFWSSELEVKLDDSSPIEKLFVNKPLDGKKNAAYS
ncbi:MAG: tetraacyldisaccharide 4'-kinase [Candidatus Melainabacteria bacterium]|nr:tetraacyldisaccharide 4'-kinase [Candidatus Melainabacteria bacterium]